MEGWENVMSIATQVEANLFKDGCFWNLGED